MGLFDQIGSAISGSGGESIGQRDMQGMIAKTDQSTLQKMISGVLRQISPQEYSEYANYGADGRSPLASLGKGGLAKLASLLMQYLGGAGVNIGSLIPMIPGLKTSDPNLMDEHQVSALAQYTQQNHPDVLGQVAAQLGKENPGTLSALLPKSGLSSIASGIASQFLEQ